MVNATPRVFYTKKEPQNPLQMKFPFWTVQEKLKSLAPNGVRIVDPPACSEALCKLHYPSPQAVQARTNKCGCVCGVSFQSSVKIHKFAASPTRDFGLTIFFNKCKLICYTINTVPKFRVSASRMLHPTFEHCL